MILAIMTFPITAPMRVEGGGCHFSNHCAQITHTPVMVDNVAGQIVTF